MHSPSDSGASSSGDAGNPDLSHLHVVPDEFRAEEVHDISRLKLSQKLLEMELEGCDAVEECADRIARKLESIQESHRGSTAASVAARKKLISSLLWDLKEFCECLGIDQVVQMPRIFTLGAQSTGKSTLINTLLHLCVAYTSHSQGTVRPTRIQAVFEPDLEVDFKISVRENRNAAPMEIDPDEIANAIKDLMKVLPPPPLLFIKENIPFLLQACVNGGVCTPQPHAELSSVTRRTNVCLLIPSG